VEAEGRAFRRAVLDAGFKLLLMTLGTLLVAGGVILFGRGLYQLLLSITGPPIASTVVGLLGLIIGTVFLWWLRRQDS